MHVDPASAEARDIPCREMHYFSKIDGCAGIYVVYTTN